MAEILSTKEPEGGVTYNIIEVTSSGLTHTHNRIIPKFKSFIEKITDLTQKNKYLISRFYDYNFGTIEFEWNNNPILTF